uniref:Glucan endo-1,3-beta-glucosidase 4 n=1 Tax=Cajanus cajan TaxID=3821 RepID=A0A151R0I9_CAJCA|nr:Glucan endo-1,3-beta-glucosidase 4 [Cajanus cajan]
METRRVRKNVGILLLYLTLASISLTHCDADRSMRLLLKGPRHRRNTMNKNPKKLKVVKHFDVNNNNNPTIFSSNVQPYSLSSPFSLPPYESLAPIPLPENSPPFCVPPYFEPTPPSIIPSPTGGITPGPPTTVPSPTEGTLPSPPTTIPTPTGGTLPSPPSTVPSPTEGSVPSPSVFQPPVVYPPPSVPPPPNYAPRTTLWCVAKPSVPDPIIQEAMNYACWSGADCTSIQPNGPCYQPDTVYAHASYAFNSYWQRTKGAGGNCEFGGTAMLVAVDPSYDGCRFIYN